MKKILIATVLSLMVISSSLVASALEPVKATKSQYYSDLDSNNMFFDSIEFISGKKIVQGYDDKTYKSGQLLNRAELLKILIASKFEPKDYESYANKNCFTDVSAGEWYTKYVCFGKAIKIVQGYDDGSFRPTQDVTLVEALKMANIDFFNTQYDQESTPWYKNYVDTAAASNFIPLNFVQFEGKVDRGQAADLIARILKNDEGTLGEFLGDNAKYVVNYDTLTKGVSPKNYSNEDLISKVCGKDDPLSSISFNCSDAKKKIYKCSNVNNVSFGDHKYLSCSMTHIDNVDVLVSTGGLLNGGYNFLIEKDGQVVVIDSVLKLLSDWGKIDSEESAKQFAIAVTGFQALDVGTHFTDAFGDKFELKVPDTDIKFTVVKKDGNQYEVPLYQKTVFGCSDFPVYQNIYTVSNTGITLKDHKQIGVVKNTGICVD